MKTSEKTSKILGVKYVYLKDKKTFVLENGAVFTLDEYKDSKVTPELLQEKLNGQLYDYAYAKNTGLLRKKRDFKAEKLHRQMAEQVHKPELEPEPEEVKEKPVEKFISNVKSKAVENKSIVVICVLLTFTSVISMYISTLHTATYLTDYVDLISAWMMSASVTAYNSTAFEVSIIFKKKKRIFLAIVFMFLWILVTVFSMATTVSIFYDRFNFTETQIAEDNKEIDSSRYQLEILQKQETDLREEIAFKRKDIEYRQEREYATTAVRNELTTLENKLQANLASQQKILSATPEASTQNKVQRKESFFSFLGRVMKVDGGVLEFIMSTMSAIFVNLIAPLSLTAVIELLYKKKTMN